MNITVKQIDLKSASGRGAVRGWIYEPGVEARGVIQICHGMLEHMGRYHEFMHFLAENGYVACGIDQIGHGHSAQEARGFFDEKDGWRMLLEDQRRFYKVVREQVGSCPAILLGHSMGSFISRIYITRHKTDFDGLILSGTGRGGLLIDTAIQVADISAKKNGARYQDTMLQKAVLNVFNRRFAGPNATPNDWLSRDTQRVRDFGQDSLCQFTFTASAFRDLFILNHKANERQSFEWIVPGLPILIFSGTMDPVGEYGKGPRFVYDRYGKLGHAHVELRLYENGRHEMLQETNRTQVYQDVLAWIQTNFQ